MSNLAGNTRAALLGILFAIVGFSYAIATFDGGADAGPAAAARVFGSGAGAVRFTNPVKVVDSNGVKILDLGDVLVGSAFGRHINAEGGALPYTFTTEAVGTYGPLNVTGITFASFLTFGSVSGTIAANATADIIFGAKVTDAAGSYAKSPFQLTLVSGNNFRFASSQLSDALQFRPYRGDFIFLNGVAASITINNPKLDGTATTLAALGLAQVDNGLSGLPLKSGVLTFTATAKSTKNTDALGRFPATTVGQAFSITIGASKSVAGTILTTALTIKQGVAKKDSIAYAGQIAMASMSIGSLSGKVVELRINNYMAPLPGGPISGTLDAKGKISTGTKTFKGQISTKGQIKIAITGETLSSFFKDVKSGDNLLVDVRILGVISGKELDPVTVKSGKNGASQITYKLGKVQLPAGTMQLIAAAGKDDTKNSTGDSWKAAFIAQPPAGTSFSGAASAKIGIGKSATTVAVSSSKGIKSTEKATKLAISDKGGKGALQTSIIAKTASGIALASTSSGGPIMLGVSIDLTKSDNSSVYSGEGSIGISPKGKGWVSGLTK